MGLCYIFRQLVFFFSSRRRHTRLTCDWSSDVCSSDLTAAAAIASSGIDAARRCSASCVGPADGVVRRTLIRSEEHTSELQSHVNLVCRLLLEKKKKEDRRKDL